MRTLLTISLSMAALSSLGVLLGILTLWLLSEGEPSVKMIAPPFDWQAAVAQSIDLAQLKRLCAPFSEAYQSDFLFHRKQSELLDGAIVRFAFLIIFLGGLFCAGSAYIAFRLWQMDRQQDSSSIDR